MATKLTNQVNNQSFMPSTDVIKLTLTMKITKGPVIIYVEGGGKRIRGSQGYFRLARGGGGGAKIFYKEI